MNYSGQDLAGVDFSSASLALADFSGCILTDVSFYKANLEGATFHDAYMTRTNLHKARLDFADFRGAHLYRADITSTILVDGGSDGRSFQFFAWQDGDDWIYQAGCQWWPSYNRAVEYFFNNYSGDANVSECLARLEFLKKIIAIRS